MKERVATKIVHLGGRFFTICGRVGDRYFDNIDRAGPHDNAFFIRVIQRCLVPGATVIDAGANIGVTSMMLAAIMRDGVVYSLEPSPSAYPLLVETIAANRAAFVHPRQLALSDHVGCLQFFDNPVSASASHLAGGGALGGESATVEATTLDAFVASQGIKRVDFIKIDVEGFETEVLSGAREIMRRDRPGVFLEFNSFALIAFGNRNPRTFLEELLAQFPYVYRSEVGAHRQVAGPDAVLDFLHRNLVQNGCVDDLYCSFVPLPGAAS
jgi:FkbM family methyltransferase